MTIRRMRIACWITKATNTHSEYVILISFPQQEWLHERASVLRYTYIACLVTTEEESVYCTVRAESVNIYQVHLRLSRVKINVGNEMNIEDHLEET